MSKAIMTIIALVLFYGGVVVAAGHALGPVALILVAGRAPEYIPTMILGWCGILALVIALARSRDRSGAAILMLAVALFGLSWLGVVWVSHLRHLTLATSIPFIALAGWLLVRRGRIGAFGGQPAQAQP